MSDMSLPDRNTRAIWERLLYMIFCAIAYSIAEAIVVLVAIFQFVCVLVNGHVHERAQRFGQNVGAYIGELLRFVTFNDERVPFPFSDWPEVPAGETPWQAPPAPPAPPAAEPAPEPPPAPPAPPTADTPTADTPPSASTTEAPEPPPAPDAPPRTPDA